MSNANGSSHSSTTLTPWDFERLSHFVRDQYHIQLPLAQRNQLSFQLHKRLHDLDIQSFSAYVDRLLDPEQGQDELGHFVDAITLHQVGFFDQPGELEYLVQHVLPELIRAHGAGIQRPFSVWNAGCGSGEEAYTLSMVLSEFADRSPGIGFKYQVLATDPSLRDINKAQRAIYSHDSALAVPVSFKKRYLLKSRDPSRRLVRVSKELRQSVRFRQLNFMAPSFSLRERMDVIFCRALFSYFDHRVRQQLVQKLCRHLTPGGYLFVGQNDNIGDMPLPMTRVAPAIFCLSA
ncbi:MAG: methyltransferase domain-containing protein [Magnetococcales bacterium]|nr:methyltransferase domain-containing protein [Magnetococcales bacterium]